MRCKCGVFLKSSQKRCKACAVDYLRQFETDRFESQIQNEPIVLNFTEDEIKRWEEMSSKKLPVVPRSVKAWSESDWRRREVKRMWLGISLIVLVLALAAWAMCSG